MRFLIAKFRESLGAQVFVAFTALIFFICISFIALFVNRQHTTLLSDWEQNGRLLAKMLAYQSRIGVFSENEEILKPSVESLFQYETVTGAAIYNSNGKVLTWEVRKNNGVRAQVPGEVGTAEKGIFKRISDHAELPVFQLKDTMVVWAPVWSGSSLPINDSPYFENGGKAKDSTRQNSF